MGSKVSRTDYEWVYTDEPHATRRKEILSCIIREAQYPTEEVCTQADECAFGITRTQCCIIKEKYPEIKKLMGYDTRFKYIVLCMVLMQFFMFWLLRNASTVTILILAYCFGGVINHSLMLAIHEIAHNLAFGHSRPLMNRAFGIFSNLPIGVPMSVAFKKYHLEHHKYQGDEILDTDIPSKLEAKLFCTTYTKLLWVCLQPLFYAFRPFFTSPKPVTLLEVINTIVQILFNIIIYYLCGPKVLFIYMISGSLMAMGLHPVAGHFISEHYMFKKGYETYSYYGPLNFITFNVGYHMEHHDFPSVPGSCLPEVKRIASEYYADLPQHNSWIKVIYDFITDPDIGPYARVIRKHKEIPKD